MPRIPVAQLLNEVLAAPELRIEAYDGSTAGPDTAKARVTLSSPKALSYVLTAPSSLGLARAFVSGELLIDGDAYDLLTAVWRDRIGQLTWARRTETLPNGDPRSLRWVKPPPEELGARRLRAGFRHSKQRDAQAISHHYDVSNRFYEWVLGPSMTYTCACYPTD